MSLNARNVPSGGNRVEQEPLEAGVYPGRLVRVIGLGTQKQRPFQGQEKDPAMELMVTYELADEFIVNEEGEIQEDSPRWVFETFPLHGLGSERATSTKRYYAIDPNEEHLGDWAELVGKPIMITLTATPGKAKHAGKVFNNIAGLSAMRAKEADKLPELVRPSVVFDFYEPDIETFMSFPEWLQTKMKEAVDYEGSELQNLVDNYKAPEGGEDKKADDEPKDEPEAKENEDEDW